MWSDGLCGTGLPDVSGTPEGDDGGPVAAAQQPRGKLVAWCVLTGLLAAVAYAGRFAGGDVPDDLLYLWSTFAGALVQYGIMLVLVLAIARGLDRRLLALAPPEARWHAFTRALAALGVILAATAVLSLFLDAGGEQGLVPDGWDGSRAAPFVANAAVIALAAPFVEELLYRGLGYGLLTRFVGPWPAIVVTGVAFSLAHGLVEGFPVLAVFGVTLGWLRWRTGSVLPGMIVHALFNAAALIASVTM